MRLPLVVETLAELPGAEGKTEDEEGAQREPRPAGSFGADWPGRGSPGIARFKSSRERALHAQCHIRRSNRVMRHLLPPPLDHEFLNRQPVPQSRVPARWPQAKRRPRASEQQRLQRSSQVRRSSAATAIAEWFGSVSWHMRPRKAGAGTGRSGHGGEEFWRNHDRSHQPLAYGDEERTGLAGCNRLRYEGGSLNLG